VLVTSSLPLPLWWERDEKEQSDFSGRGAQARHNEAGRLSNQKKVPPTMLQALRDATSPLHDKLEECMPLMRPDLSPAAYLQVLKNFYGLYAPLEATLLVHPAWLALLSDAPDRQRLPHLKLDLEALGVSLAEQEALPLCPLPDMSQGLEQVLGCMYVMEGSTLGGQHMVRHLKAHFGWDEADDSKTHFFNSYGKQVGPRWKAFCEVLQTFCAQQTPEEQQVTIASAVGMFELLEQWFTAHPVQELDTAKR
jgi:heme oxygenase (biliverdin-IX-beta and delta-forming)